MEALRVKKAFVYRMGQAGKICVRMALLTPAKIEGIMPLGVSMTSPSAPARVLGCGNETDAGTGPIDQWTTTKVTPDFEPDDDFCNFLIDIGYGKTCDGSVWDFWKKTIKSNHHGEDGYHQLQAQGGAMW